MTNIFKFPHHNSLANALKYQNPMFCAINNVHLGAYTFSLTTVVESSCTHQQAQYKY